MSLSNLPLVVELNFSHTNAAKKRQKKAILPPHLPCRLHFQAIATVTSYVPSTRPHLVHPSLSLSPRTSAVCFTFKLLLLSGATTSTICHRHDRSPPALLAMGLGLRPPNEEKEMHGYLLTLLFCLPFGSFPSLPACLPASLLILIPHTNKDDSAPYSCQNRISVLLFLAAEVGVG